MRHAAGAPKGGRTRQCGEGAKFIERLVWHLAADRWKLGPVNALQLLLIGASVASAAAASGAAVLPPLDVRLGHARAFTAGDRLCVSSGCVERDWRWTGAGLATVGLEDLRTGRNWVAQPEYAAASDWALPGLMGHQPARLVSLSAAPSTDGQFTSEMLQVVAEVVYPQSGLAVRFVVWTYPDGPGFRTQLWVKGKPVRSTTASSEAAEGRGSPRAAPPAAETARTDYLPITFSHARAVGYFNDTQHRNKPETHLIRDEAAGLGEVNWANLVSTEDARGGVILVKESHKCVNQPGVNTGAFLLLTNGTAVTGWGLPLSALSPDAFHWCWATWTILYNAPGADARQLAVKQFDRLRYPVNEALDIELRANTWGSGATSLQSVQRASEDQVLAEIDSVAGLGLDSLEIDDGWQTGRMPGEHPARDKWLPRPDWYPKGWSDVVARATQRHIKLGLWLAANAPLSALQWNYRQGHFRDWKLDFANLSTYDLAESCLAKARNFIDYTHHKVRVHWDVTENAPRFGYFWARECGSIWLENRKPARPANVIARPWLQLRDAWELARYLNANQFELGIQNYAMVDGKLSDAPLYSMAYSTALGLPGVPLFFQTTRLLTARQRRQIKALLAPYKEHRRDLFESFVFPIGEEPDNAAWSGFQWVKPGAAIGYLLMFRERLNREAHREVALHFLKPGTVLNLENLRTGSSDRVTVTPAAAAPLDIPQATDVLFMRYQIVR